MILAARRWLLFINNYNLLCFLAWHGKAVGKFSHLPSWNGRHKRCGILAGHCRLLLYFQLFDDLMDNVKTVFSWPVGMVAIRCCWVAASLARRRRL